MAQTTVNAAHPHISARMSLIVNASVDQIFQTRALIQTNIALAMDVLSAKGEAPIATELIMMDVNALQATCVWMVNACVWWVPNGHAGIIHAFVIAIR